MSTPPRSASPSLANAPNGAPLSGSQASSASPEPTKPTVERPVVPPLQKDEKPAGVEALLSQEEGDKLAEPQPIQPDKLATPQLVPEAKEEKLPEPRPEQPVEAPVKVKEEETPPSEIQEQPMEGAPSSRAGQPSNESLGWLPATDETPVEADVARKGSILKGGPQQQQQQQQRQQQEEQIQEMRRSTSLSKRSFFTGPEGTPIEGSTFMYGAGTTGPGVKIEPTEELSSRAASADANLSPKEKSKIAKVEAKEGRKLSKIILEEGKAEREALAIAINELGELQKLQKISVKNEAKAFSVHTRVLADFRKEQTSFLAARAKFEAAESRLRSDEETLESLRQAARETTERLQGKSQEVESLRAMFSVDERERTTRLKEINNKGKNKLWW